MSDDIQKWFLDISLEHAQELGEYGQDIRREYERYLRLHGLQPLQDDPGPEAERLRAEIAQQLQELGEIPITDRKEEPRTEISIYLARFTEEEPDELDKEMEAELDRYFAAADRTEEHTAALEALQKELGE